MMYSTRDNSQEKKAVWSAIRTIYKLLAMIEAQGIIQLLLKNKEMRSTDLMMKAGLTEAQFHPIMRQLVKYSVIERNVGQDRSVSYSISLFGKNVLNISEKLLEEVKTAIPKKQLLAE